MRESGKGERARILVLASTYPRWEGDPEPGFVHQLCKRLVKRFDVIVVTPGAPGASDRDRIDGVEIRRYRYAPRAMQTMVHNGGIVANLRRSPWKLALLPSFLIGQWWVARKIVGSSRVDAIHAHWIIPQGLLGAWLGRPMLVTCHGADVFALKGRVFSALRGYVRRRARDVSVVSRAMAASLHAESGNLPLPLIRPMGVDTALFCMTPSDTHDGGLLFVGRLVEKKGLHYLLQALPPLIMAAPGLTLTIAGFGPERERLEAEVRRLDLDDHVRFLGPVAHRELPALYRRATLFVAPFVEGRDGDREGLGLVAAEAMACGCPAVLGNVASVDDLVGDGHALVVDPRSVTHMVEAIASLLADAPRRFAMANEAVRFVCTRFSLDAVADGYADALEVIVAARGPARSEAARG